MLRVSDSATNGFSKINNALVKLNFQVTRTHTNTASEGS